MRLNRLPILGLALLLLVPLFQPKGALAQQRTKPTAPTVAPPRLFNADPENPAAMVQTFGSMSPTQFRAWLNRAQPAPISTADRNAAFPRAAWKAQIAIVGDPETCARLQQQAGPVLKLFKRERVVRFVVYLDNYPQVQTIAHSYIAVSTGLLQIIKTESQLNGLVAHELAREIRRDAYYSAWENEDLHRMRRIELFCDAVATAALHATGLSGDEYAVILGRMINYTTVSSYANRALATSRHPTLDERQTLIRQINMKQSQVDSSDRIHQRAFLCCLYKR